MKEEHYLKRITKSCFGRIQEVLIRDLLKVQKQLCGYIQASWCDCKYGAEEVGGHSESNGCPEVRLAAKIIDAMTEKEYTRMCKRAKITIT